MSVFFSMKIIAFDIETTGQHLFGSDSIFAIGACVARLQENGTFEILSKHLWTRSLDKPPDVDWETWWTKMTFYEPRCFKEFWSKHLDVLEALQQHPTAKKQEQLAKQLSDFLKDQEEDGPFSLLFDTVLFDSVWLDTLLRRNGFAGLAMNRDFTGWRSAFELDSYRFGATGTPLGNWIELSTRCDANPRIALQGADLMPHNPQDDALGIVVDLARVMNAKHSKIG